MIGTPEELSKYLWQLDKEKKYIIEEYKEKRSLNANNYAWVLITQIGNKLRKSKEEVYLQMLKNKVKDIILMKKKTPLILL